MRCPDFRRQYSAYRDSQDPEVAAAMEDHLTSCRECRAYDRAVRDGVAALRVETVVPSADFLDRLEARLATTDRVPEPIPPKVSPWAATAAAVMLVALVVFTIRESAVVPPVSATERPAVLAEPRMVAGVPFVTFQRAK